MFEFPVLLGDIGGTNARFAVLPAPGAPAQVLPRGLTADHPEPVDAIRAALARRDGPAPRSALLAVATRIERPTVRLTNADWVVDAERIGTVLGLDRVALVNDYVPMAAALPALDLRAGDVVRLGPALPAGAGARLVLGPGTGLGAAALLPAGGRSYIQSTEAGHVEFGPSDADEATIWPELVPVAGRITAEAVLSGPGLLRLYGALCAARGGTAQCLAPNDVTEAGASGRDPLAAETLRLFARLLGRFAGDLALVFGATGGVFIGSGIAPRMLDLLGEGGFREAFERKAPFDALARAVPTWIVTHPEPALHGLAVIATAPDRFIFESHGWSASA